MHITKFISVDTNIKRVLKATASMLLIIALTMTMLTVSGLGTNRSYADSSTSTNSTLNKYAVLIRDNSSGEIKSTINIYLTKTTADTIKSDFADLVKAYLLSKNPNIISVTVNDTVDVTPVSSVDNQEPTKTDNGSSSAATSDDSSQALSSNDLSGAVSTPSTDNNQASAVLSLAVTKDIKSVSDDKIYSLDDAIATMLSKNYFDITTVEKSTKSASIKYRTIYKNSSKVRKTVRKVKQAGKEGSSTTLNYVTTTTKAGGASISSTKCESVSTVKAVNRIVIKGTGSSTVKKGSTYNGTSGKDIVKYAKKFLGNPYVYGGTSLTNGCDCSGFVQSVYKHFGLTLPRTSQYRVGKRVSLKHLKPGDLLSYSGHVAIYAGNGKIVHAVTEGQGIRLTSMYYGGTPYRATRIVQ